MKKIGKGFLIVICVVLALIAMVLFKGCQELSDDIKNRRIKDQQMISHGRELLKQALMDNYGLREGDYDVINERLFTYDIDKMIFDLKIGDKIGYKVVMAEVNLECDEVFFDYYKKEFEDALISYIERKMESNPQYKEMGFKRLNISISFHCMAGGIGEVEYGMLPVSVKPDGFDKYLEKCDHDGSLYVGMKLDWYSEESKEVPERLKDIMSPDNGEIPAYLEVSHFKCGSNADLQPTDLVDTCTFYREDSEVRNKIDRRSYEYLQVTDDLIVERYFDSYHPKDAVNDNDFHAELDNKGHLHITPADKYYNIYYNIYFRDTQEDANIPFVYRYRNGENTFLVSTSMQKSGLYSNWYVGEADGFDIMIPEVIIKSIFKKFKIAI